MIVGVSMSLVDMGAGVGHLDPRLNHEHGQGMENNFDLYDLDS